VSEEYWEVDTAALAAEAEVGYWCREPIGHGEICGQLGRPVDLPVGLHRPVLCEQHRKGWGREL
jgi:hypothetical protein